MITTVAFRPFPDIRPSVWNRDSGTAGPFQNGRLCDFNSAALQLTEQASEGPSPAKKVRAGLPPTSTIRPSPPRHRRTSVSDEYGEVGRSARLLPSFLCLSVPRF